MPNGFFKPEKRRGLAQNFIRSGVQAGLSGRAILSSLREVGLGYRTATFYADYRRWTDLKLYELPIMELPDEQLIPQAFTKSTGLNLSTDYLYKLRAEYLDVATGTYEEVFWGVSSNQQLSKEECYEVAAAFREYTERERELVFINVSVYQAWKR